VTPGSEDRDLRDLFARCRQEDRRRAPSFATVLAAAERLDRPSGLSARPRRLAWGAAGLGAAALALMGVLVIGDREASRDLDEAIALAEALSSWTAPTDTLLEVPGLVIPDTVPSMDMRSIVLPGLDERGDDGSRNASTNANG
jgi:hypothetical protein